MTFNTGNPIGSTDARDLSDNAENFDYLENSTTELTHVDRLGTVRKTRHGMEVEHDVQIAAHETEHDAQMQSFENDFDSRLAGMGFTRVGTFNDGYTLTDVRQTLLWEISQGGDGQEYGWSGAFPKVVPASSTPASTGGISVGAWISRFDPELRIQVREALRRSYAEAGYNLVAGSFEAGGTVTAVTDVLLYETDGKAYSWGGTLPHTVVAGSSPSAEPGMWVDRSAYVLAPLTRSALISWATGANLDDGSIVEADGLKYRRVSGSTAIPDFLGFEPEGVASPRHWGIYPSEILDQTTSITAMLRWTDLTGCQLDWDDGMYRFSSYLSNAQNPKVKWRTKGKTVLYSTKSSPVGPGYEDDYFIKYTAPTIRVDDVTSNFYAGGNRLTIGSTADIEVGTMVIVQTTRMIETDHRGQARHGFAVPVARVISPTQIELQRTIPTTCLTTNVDGSVTSVSSATSLVVSGLSALGRSEARYKITFNTGVAAGLSAYVTDFNVDTQTIFCDPTNSSFPPGIVAGDSFTIVRGATISITNIVKFDVQGDFEIQRAFHTGATAGDLGFRGLFVEKGDRPILHGMIARNFSETGIRIGGWCYAPDVKNIECYNANRAYGGSNGTGYGVSVFQSSWGTFENIVGYGCRRTLDFAGTQGVSYYNETENVSGFGGGETYITGKRFWPVSDGETNSVVGSHGAAVGTLYCDSRGQDVYDVVHCRGDAEKARGIYGTGAITQMARVFYGDGLDIDGIYYRDIGFDWALPKNKRLQPSDVAKKLLEVVRIVAWNTISSRTNNIRNIDVQGSSRTLVSIEGPGTVGPIVVSNANLYVDNEDGSSNNFDVIRNTNGSAVILGGNVILDNVRIHNNPSAPKTTIHWLNVVDFTFSSGVCVRLPSGNLLVSIADDGVVAIPTVRSLGATILSVRSHAANKDWHLINALVWGGIAADHGRLANTTATGVSGVGTSTKLENSYKVDVMSTALTGVTGVDGRISVSYNPGTESNLYIENRTGLLTYAVITCDAVAI